MRSKPFFNVVIPTRERSTTLFWTIKSCLDQDYDHYQIIVSDNCSLDNTQDIVTGFQSPRIKYIKTPHRVSMSHNWEFALNHIEKGFVMFLGDDDGLVKNSLNRLAKLIYKTNAQAYRLSNITYYWDNPFTDNPFTSNMCYNINLTDYYYKVNSKPVITYLAKTLEYHGEQGFLLLPSLYHGCVHHDVISAIRQDSGGTFFRSNCPDMFSALAFANKLENFIHYPFPVCINGLSKFSNGLSSYQVNKRTDEKDIEFDKFIKENPIPFYPKLIFDMALAQQYLIPRPILVADQFFRLQQIYPDLTLPALAVILESSIKYAIHASQNQTDLDSHLAIVEHVANINNGQDIFEVLKQSYQLADRKYNPQTYVNSIIFDYDITSSQATINTGLLKLGNVYEVSQYLNKLVEESQKLNFYAPKDATKLTNKKKRSELLLAKAKHKVKEMLWL